MVTCATCPERIDEAPCFHWCGLERTENSDVDVSGEEWKPFDFQPDWCLLRRPKEEREKLIRQLREEREKLIRQLQEG